LVIGNFIAGVAGDQEIDLFAGMLSRIAFFADEVNGAHEGLANGQPNTRSMQRQTIDFGHF
jgi:hypothetical protein